MELIIFGTGDIGELAHFYLERDSDHEVVAFTADEQYIASGEKEYRGLPLVPFEELPETYGPADYGVFVALSYRELNQNRARKFHEVREAGYETPSYVCSRSVLWDDLMYGENCFIFENQTIQPFVDIGDNVTLWSGNHIGHHSTVGDHVFMTSHVVVSGHCQIGPYSFLGVNAALRDGVELAEGTVVGAGATVVEDTEPYGVYLGTPAEKVDDRGDEIDYFTETEYGGD